MPKLPSEKESLVTDSDKLDTAHTENGEDTSVEEIKETDKAEITQGISISQKVKEFFALPKQPSTKESPATITESKAMEEKQGDEQSKEDEKETKISRGRFRKCYRRRKIIWHFNKLL